MKPPPTYAIIAGGGTAGHLLPGLSVADALVERGHPAETIHFVGSDRGIEASLVPKAGFSLDELPGRGVERRPSIGAAKALLGLVRAVIVGMRIVRRRRPAVVVVLGGHAAVACAVGAVLFRVPMVVLEQNARAGAVNRIFGRFAAAVAASIPGTDLPRAVVTGNPLRPELIEAAAGASREVARRELGLPVDRTVLAVFSGSLGSRQINSAVRGLVERWSDRSDLTVRHVVGRRDHDEFVADLPTLPAAGLHYSVIPYEDRMDLLLAAADAAVTRAGGSLFELAVFGLPAVLVPLPIATRDHQTANARYASEAGAAVHVPDSECTTDRLASELDTLLSDPGRLAGMSAAMRAIARPDAAFRVADLVEEHARG